MDIAVCPNCEVNQQVKVISNDIHLVMRHSLSTTPSNKGIKRQCFCPSHPFIHPNHVHYSLPIANPFRLTHDHSACSISVM